MYELLQIIIESFVSFFILLKGGPGFSFLGFGDQAFCGFLSSFHGSMNGVLRFGHGLEEDAKGSSRMAFHN